MTASRFRINLGKDAVKLALDGQWARAAELNRAILELYPDDCEAANRLAKALMELADYAAARTVLSDLRVKHPNNNIARKNLARLEKLESAGAPRQSAPGSVAELSPLFIEEGGKSCTTTLRPTGDASAVAGIVAGDTATLSICGDSVVAYSTDDQRLGSVEPRLARRLRKLMDWREPLRRGHRQHRRRISVHRHPGDSAAPVPAQRGVLPSAPPQRRRTGRP